MPRRNLNIHPHPRMELSDGLDTQQSEHHFETNGLLANADSDLPLLAQSLSQQAGETSGNPTSFSLFLESGLSGLDKCHGWCSSRCARLFCCFPGVLPGYPDQPSELDRALLSSSFENDFNDFRGPAGSTRRPPDCEVVNWMRRRLCYFFMTPLLKYKAKKRLPFKLFIAIFKLIFVTLQIVEFGFSRASHVSFEQDSNIAFRHLYLRNWDAQYETLAYPPAVGLYAVYRREEMLRTISFAIQQYNMTEKVSIGAYLFETRRPALQLCVTSLPSTTTDQPHSLTKCADLQVDDISADDLEEPHRMEAFLVARNLSFSLAELSHIDLRFTLLTPVLTELNWAKGAECFSFAVHIAMHKKLQSGMMRIELSSDSQSVFCTNPVSPEREANSVRRLWAELASTGSASGRLSLRRTLIVVLDVIVICLSTLSLVLCIRSVVRSLKLWRETVVFFRVWFDISLVGACRDFSNFWWLLILTNDLLLFSTSLTRLVAVYHVENLHGPIAYIFGVSAILIWSDVLRFIAFSAASSLLMRTIVRSIPSLVRFSICSLILFFAFSLCGWLVLGPYHLKFHGFGSTMECLFSLLNGDDMYVTFSVIGEQAPPGVYVFSRVFLYLFVSLFIYVVLNLLITIIFEAYEEVKMEENSHGRPQHPILWRFVHERSYSPNSPVFREDDRRLDRHSLHLLSQGRWPVTEQVQGRTASAALPSWHEHWASEVASSSSLEGEDRHPPSSSVSVLSETGSTRSRDRANAPGVRRHHSVNGISGV